MLLQFDLKHIHKVNFYPSDINFTQALLVLLVTNMISGSCYRQSMLKLFSYYCCSGVRGVGQISASHRCPAKKPCPYKSGKCGRLVSVFLIHFSTKRQKRKLITFCQVGLGPGGSIPACPRKRFYLREG